MSFFKKIFGGTAEETTQPAIKFGRYTDSNKSADKYDAWDKALEYFEKEEYLSSYNYFFEYLRDEGEDNVKWHSNGEGMEFELFQGSMRITGTANQLHFKAQAKIARAHDLNVGFMRRLIEYNFNLRYSRFALDPDNNLCIVFDTYTVDGSPYKLYYALKEMATNADKQDDLLIDEFKMLQPVAFEHVIPLNEVEKQAKFDFLQYQISNVLDCFDNGKIDVNKYPGAAAYLLLNLIYKLDYLINPEGYLMEAFENMHRVYFASDQKTTTQKNMVLAKELRKLLNRPKNDFFKELYAVRSTFGITTAVSHDRIVGFIDAELHNMDWYADNGYGDVALSIPSYIIGYCLFNYAAPKPIRDLFLLYYQTTEPVYFTSLGYRIHYMDPASKSLNKKEITRAIYKIEEENQPAFRKLDIAVHRLQFNSMTSFAKSFLLMVKELDLTDK